MRVTLQRAGKLLNRDRKLISVLVTVYEIPAEPQGGSVVVELGEVREAVEDYDRKARRRLAAPDGEFAGRP